MWTKGDGEAYFWRPQRLTGKSEGLTVGTTSDCPRGTWPDGSSTTLCTEMGVWGGEELDVENVEVGETYLRTG